MTLLCNSYCNTIALRIESPSIVKVVFSERRTAMSIDVTEDMIQNAQDAITAGDPYSTDTVSNLRISVEQSLPAYWTLYKEKSESIESCSESDKAQIFRGLASDAIQFVTASHFGFRLHRVGNQLIASDVDTIVIALPEGASPLEEAYPLGMKIVSDRVEENSKGTNGTIWDPIGTDDEPEAESHLDFLGALSDARLKHWCAARNVQLAFRNCCTTYTSTHPIDGDLVGNVRLFTSPAAQILNQHTSRKALHC